VADAAIRRDPEWMPNISDVWTSRKPTYQLVHDFIDRLATKAAPSDNEKELIAHSLDRLFDLQKYPFTALEIAPSVDEVVRVNSEGSSSTKPISFSPSCRYSGMKAEPR
jgi:hypothetical protein